MLSRTLKSRRTASFAAVAAAWLPMIARADSGSAFLYQGEIREGGSPAAGTFDLKFGLFVDDLGTIPIGPTVCANDVQVVDGRFTQLLDFGPVFGADRRYLAVSVRRDDGAALVCESVAGYTALGPVQAIEATPVVVESLSAVDAAAAESAATADQSDDASTLGGHPASVYTNLANRTGTLRSAALSGVYPGIVSFTYPGNILRGDGAGLTNLQANAAVHADTATSAQAALNASMLNGQDVNYWRNIGLRTGVLPAGSLVGLYTNWIRMNAPTGQPFVFHGNGGNLTNLQVSRLTGTTGPSALGGGYTAATRFLSTCSLKGQGYGVTSLNANALTSGQVPLGVLPVRSDVTAQQSVIGGWAPNPGSNWVAVPGSSHTKNFQFTGNAVMNWTFTMYLTAPNTMYQVAPLLDGVPQGAPIPMCFNQAISHEYAAGMVSFPISSGTHTVSLGIRYGNQGSGLPRADGSDCVSWALINTR